MQEDGSLRLMKFCLMLSLVCVVARSGVVFWKRKEEVRYQRHRRKQNTWSQISQLSRKKNKGRKGKALCNSLVKEEDVSVIVR